MKHFISNKKTLLFILCAVTGITGTAQNWTGNVNSDWNNAANWTGWPVGGDDILIDPANYTGAAAAPVINANSVFIPQGVLIQNGAVLTVNANLSATGRVEIMGAGTVVNITGGTLHASGSGSDGRFIAGDGAAINMTGGTLTANQRVIVELGAVFTLNNGTIQPGELAIGDGNLTASSLFNMNGGTINISAGLGFENEAGLFYPTFNMTGGNLVVNGGISWLGEAPGAGTPKFIMSGGTATVNGDIINDPASTVDLYMHIGGNADFTFDGAAINQVRLTDSIKQSGNAVVQLDNTHNWNNAGVFYATGGITIFNGITSLTGTGTYTFYQTEINTGKSLLHVSTSTVRVNGDFVNNGTYTANMHPVLFGGSMAQTISGSTVTNFHLLILNNAAGLTLNRSAAITGHLLLSDGKLNTSATHLLTVLDNATASSGSATSFVNGPLKKTGNDAFVFPIGKNAKWRRLEISAPPLATSEFTAEYFDDSYVSTTPVSSPLVVVSNLEYWALNRLNVSDDVELSLYWEDASASAITDCTELSMAAWNGSSWNNILSSASGTCTGTGNGQIKSNAVVSHAAAYTFGFYGGVTVQDLSICYGDSVTVGSNTYNVSGTYVDVLVASDMSDSVVVTQLQVSEPAAISFDGAILTAGPATADTYQWVDCDNGYAPIPGQTSQTFGVIVNGNYAVVVTQGACTDTSACYSVTNIGLTEMEKLNDIKVYPNPGNGLFTLETNDVNNARYLLTDATGSIIMQAGIFSGKTTIDYTTQPQGIYFLQVTSGDKTAVTKLVKF